MPDLQQPRTQAAALTLVYALVGFGVFFGASPDDRIGGLLFVFVLLAGLLGAAVVRLRPVPMAGLLWILAAAQTVLLIAMLAAHVRNPGIIAFVNVLLIAGMVFVAGAFGRAAGRHHPR